MAKNAPSELFVRHLTEYQSRLYAYILALLGDPNVVNDVLQDTNVTIWRKADEFDEGSNFGAWASRVAYYEVMAFRKRRSKDRHVFDDALLETMAEHIGSQCESMEAELRTLHRCVEKLSKLDQELVSERYGPGGSVRQLAEGRGKSVGAISQALYRIRNELADCVEQASRSEDRP
jgi:RNA polymerase sigma-70 factor, ECF subfamily